MQSFNAQNARVSYARSRIKSNRHGIKSDHTFGAGAAATAAEAAGAGSAGLVAGDLGSAAGFDCGDAAALFEDDFFFFGIALHVSVRVRRQE